jgi:hypothetical protein
MEWHAGAIDRWIRCSEMAADRLESARLALHWAVQPIAAAGQSAIAARPDYSHTALGYVPEHGALVGESLDDGRRFGLALVDLELIELVDGRVDARRSLIGQTLAQAYDWIGDRLQQARLTAPALIPPDYGADGVPETPVSQGAAFDDRERTARQALADWFANAADLLGSLRADDPAASPVRCWPHHFDIATLLTFDPDEPDAEKARSCGLGFSPGDSSSSGPYFYVGPWPHPSPDDLPPLSGGGTWITEGWVGARLDASKIVNLGEARAQAEQALAFLSSGLAASRLLLGI